MVPAASVAARSLAPGGPGAVAVTWQVKELSESAAVIRGADVLGEAVVLGVGVGVLAYEVWRGHADKAKSEKKAREEKEAESRRRDLRFEDLEDAVRLLRQQVKDMQSER